MVSADVQDEALSIEILFTRLGVELQILVNLRSAIGDLDLFDAVITC